MRAISELVFITWLLAGCVSPPPSPADANGTSVTILCVLWSSCAADSGTAGGTTKEGGPAVLVPGEPVGGE
jgi:PBP1b-binding outer membrane lipoprotein LpoB